MNGVDAGEENAEKTLNHNFDLPKRSYVIASKKTVSCEGDDLQQEDLDFPSALATANLSIEAEQGLARQTASFFQSHYGVKFDNLLFSNMSGEAFKEAKPEGLDVEEEADRQYGVVTCDGPSCFDNSEEIDSHN